MPALFIFITAAAALAAVLLAPGAMVLVSLLAGMLLLLALFPPKPKPKPSKDHVFNTFSSNSRLQRHARSRPLAFCSPGAWRRVLAYRASEAQPLVLQPLVGTWPLAMQMLLSKVEAMAMRDMVDSWAVPMANNEPVISSTIRRSFIRPSLESMKLRMESVDVVSLVLTRFLPSFTAHIREYRAASIAAVALASEKSSSSTSTSTSASTSASVTNTANNTTATTSTTTSTATTSSKINAAKLKLSGAAMETLLESCYRGGKLHPAVMTDDGTSEMEYLNKLVSVLAPALVPYNDLQSHCVNVVLRDIVICKMLKPTLDLLSDPDYLNQNIDVLASKEIKDQNMLMQFREALDKPFKAVIGDSIPTGDDSAVSHDASKQTRSFDDFLREIKSCQNLLDARQIRHHIFTEIRKRKANIEARSKEGSFSSSKIEDINKHISRLYVALKRVDKKIVQLGGKESLHSKWESMESERSAGGSDNKAVVMKPQDFKLANILTNSTALFYFTEYMERCGPEAHAQLQFWLSVQSFRVMLDEMLQSKQSLQSTAPGDSSISEKDSHTLRSDALFIYSQFCNPATASNTVSLPQQILEEIAVYVSNSESAKDTLPSSSPSSTPTPTSTLASELMSSSLEKPDHLTLVDERSINEQCILRAQEHVFQAMEEIYLPRFLKSDLFIKWTNETMAGDMQQKHQQTSTIQQQHQLQQQQNEKEQQQSTSYGSEKRSRKRGGIMDMFKSRLDITENSPTKLQSTQHQTPQTQQHWTSPANSVGLSSSSSSSSLLLSSTMATTTTTTTTTPATGVSSLSSASTRSPQATFPNISDERAMQHIQGDSIPTQTNGNELYPSSPTESSWWSSSSSSVPLSPSSSSSSQEAYPESPTKAIQAVSIGSSRVNTNFNLRADSAASTLLYDDEVSNHQNNLFIDRDEAIAQVAKEFRRIISNDNVVKIPDHVSITSSSEQEHHTETLSTSSINTGTSSEIPARKHPIHIQIVAPTSSPVLFGLDSENARMNAEDANLSLPLSLQSSLNQSSQNAQDQQNLQQPLGTEKRMPLRATQSAHLRFAQDANESHNVKQKGGHLELDSEADDTDMANNDNDDNNDDDNDMEDENENDNEDEVDNMIMLEDSAHVNVSLEGTVASAEGRSDIETTLGKLGNSKGIPAASEIQRNKSLSFAAKNMNKVPSDLLSLDEDIDRVTKQKEIVETLIHKSKDFSGGSDELRILRKSLAALNSELGLIKKRRRLTEEIVAKRMLIPGRCTVRIPFPSLAKEKNKEFVLFYTEIDTAIASASTSHSSSNPGSPQSPSLSATVTNPPSSPSLASLNPNQKLSWSLSRRYSDFFALHEIVRRHWPEAENFEFPGKRVIRIFKLQRDFIESRRLGLQRYLQKLVDHAEISGSNILRAFFFDINFSAKTAEWQVADDIHTSTTSLPLQQQQYLVPTSIGASSAPSTPMEISNISSNFTNTSSIIAPSPTIKTAAVLPTQHHPVSVTNAQNNTQARTTSAQRKRLSDTQILGSRPSTNFMQSMFRTMSEGLDDIFSGPTVLDLVAHSLGQQALLSAADNVHTTTTLPTAASSLSQENGTDQNPSSAINNNTTSNNDDHEATRSSIGNTATMSGAATAVPVSGFTGDAVNVNATNNSAAFHNANEINTIPNNLSNNIEPLRRGPSGFGAGLQQIDVGSWSSAYFNAADLMRSTAPSSNTNFPATATTIGTGNLSLPYAEGNLATNSNNSGWTSAVDVATFGAQWRAYTEEVFNSFTEPAIDLFIEVFSLREKSNWLRRQAVVLILQQMFGGTLERHLVENVRWFVSEEMMQWYITTFRDTFWPGGTMAQDWPIRTQTEMDQTKRTAYHKLLVVLPAMLGSMVGRSNARRGAKIMFDSLQHRRLTRHLVYVLLDECVMALFPEIEWKKHGFLGRCSVMSDENM